MLSGPDLSLSWWIPWAIWLVPAALLTWVGWRLTGLAGAGLLASAAWTLLLYGFMWFPPLWAAVPSVAIWTLAGGYMVLMQLSEGKDDETPADAG